MISDLRPTDQAILLSLIANAETYCYFRAELEGDISKIRQDLIDDVQEAQGRGNLGVPATRMPDNKSPELRLWFREHLHDPFPSLTSRDSLAFLAGISVLQLQQYFINLRRRSGYNRLLKAHFGGDRARLAGYLLAYQRREKEGEENEAIKQAVERYIVYVCGSEDDKRVGAWLSEVRRFGALDSLG